MGEGGQDRAMTRCRIVDAATALFWRDGYHAVSTDAICRAAKVSKSSLYHAFPSKEEVAAAALERVWSANWTEVCAIYDAAGGEAAKFRAHLDWFVATQRRLRDQHGAVMGTFDMALGVAAPAQVREAMRAHQQVHGVRLRRSIDTALGSEVAADQTAWLADVIMQTIAGAMIRARLNDDLAPLEALPDVVLKLISTARTAALSGA